MFSPSSYQPSNSLPFSSSNSNTQNKTTLWMGELEPWMDEQYITRLWSTLNAHVLVKIIRDKTTFISSGYAFVDFESISAAQCALDMFNGEIIPNTSCLFKLNWASGGGLVDRKEDRQPEHSVFLGDLSADCTEQILFNIFSSRYPSCKSAKIMTDPRTGLTRGYGFVRFSHPSDQLKALVEMQGFIIGHRPIRVSLATPKNNSSSSCTTTTTAMISSPPPSQVLQQQQQQQENTTVFIGGLSCPLQEEELKQYFSIFGDIIYVKIPPGKGCGFVQFVNRQSAEMAIDQMNGYQIGSSRIRLSWGRSQADKLLSNKMLMMSPSSSSTTSNLPFGSFRPLSPPMIQQQQTESFYFDQLQQQQQQQKNHYIQQQEQQQPIDNHFGHYGNNNNSNTLFQDRDDWFSSPTSPTSFNHRPQLNNVSYSTTTNNSDNRQKEWLQHMNNGISYA